jgi:hypothetical protein
MASKTTQAIAARVPNAVANEPRDQARRSGVTVSDLVGSSVKRSLAYERCTACGSVLLWSNAG